MLKLIIVAKGRGFHDADAQASTYRQRRASEVDEVTVLLHIEALKEGGYVATSPDVPGSVAEGRSVMEAVEMAQGLTR